MVYNVCKYLQAVTGKRELPYCFEYYCVYAYEVIMHVSPTRWYVATLLWSYTYSSAETEWQSFRKWCFWSSERTWTIPEIGWVLKYMWGFVQTQWTPLCTGLCIEVHAYCMHATENIDQKQTMFVTLPWIPFNGTKYNINLAAVAERSNVVTEMHGVTLLLLLHCTVFIHKCWLYLPSPLLSSFMMT